MNDCSWACSIIRPLFLDWVYPAGLWWSFPCLIFPRCPHGGGMCGKAGVILLAFPKEQEVVGFDFSALTAAPHWEGKHSGT